MSAVASRTIITGAAGFAGQFLVEALGSADMHGWALPGTIPATSGRLIWHEVDITDSVAVEAAVRRLVPDRLFHLAGAPSVETSWQNAVPHLSINAGGTANLLDAIARHAPRCRVLVVTSAQVYRTEDGPIDEQSPLVPSSPYGLTKLAQDQLAEAAAAEGLDVLRARPFNHIGPRQTPGFAIPSFARQIARIERRLDPPVIRVGNLDARRDFTDVRDVATAYARIMEEGASGRVYNVCSGQAFRIGDLLDALVARAGVPIAIELDPARFRPVDVPVIVGSAARLAAELGWSPRWPIETTLTDTLTWWRDQAASMTA